MSGGSTPIDIATRSTVDFIAGQLQPGAHVIEVGCGAGDVASRLRERGYRVTGIESDDESLTMARARGVPLIAGYWPDVDAPRADAVVFTRSLHHIRALDGAIGRARECLGESGTLLVEDFAFESADAATITWFKDVVAAGLGQGIIRPTAGELAIRVAAADAPLVEWHQDHDHDLHAWPEMATAVADCFSQITVSEAPYLYRYLIPVVDDSAQALRFLQQIHDREANSDDPAFRLLGRRLIANP